MIRPTASLAAGDLLLGTRDGGRRFDSRVVAVEDVPAGYPVKGPRGGRYRLTAEGARAYVLVRLANGTAPLLKRAGHVTVVPAAAPVEA